MPTTRLGIAVDGGGTKTTACVATRGEDGRAKVLAEATAGAANPAAVGLDRTRQNIAQAIAQALASAQVVDPSIDRIVAGLAGIEATNAHDELAAWARQEFDAAQADFCTDVELLHFAGSRNLPAIVLIAGTGSVAFGRSSDGCPARTGGRGYLMGDEGSGFWIGQRGLIAAVRALDHAAPETALVELIGKDLGSQDADGWTKEIYRIADPRDRISRMSHHVVQAAGQGDRVAAAILDDTGRELAHLVSSVAKQLDLTNRRFDLILAGGILINVEKVRIALDQHLTLLGLPIENQCAIESPAVEAAKRSVES